jgi:hypothetical protein
MHVVPRDDNKDGIVWVDLVCYLRNFEEGSERAYSTKLKTIPIDGLLLFFSRYINDPEAALLEYFGWEDRAPPESSRTSRQRAPTIQFTTDPMEDLL